MVSKKDIQSLDFKTIEEYFEYIVDSKINGNYNQANELFNDLSKTQKKDFIEYKLAISMGLVGYDLYCEEGYFVIGGSQEGDLDRLLFFIDKLKS
jgi:hypothetical protein